MMIPFLKQEDLILDNSRLIMPGAKIEVYDPVSNDYVDVYTYDGSNERYTVATNPVYLNLQSRPEHTYFADRLVLCRLYKYIGNFSDPRVDDDTNNWKFIREWNGAFTQESVKNDTIIFGIDALVDANPELGSVTVVGYWTDRDCEARTYVWDNNCVQTPDNGYIVKARDIDTGRWILKFDGEYLPSTYYGVYPGREANINALLTYVDTVGSNLTKTAPGVYFTRGTYDASTVALVTSKKLQIDAGTKFTRNYIQCNDVDIIGNNSQWICDFRLTNPNATVHSSWFRTLQGFFDSDAKHYIVDNINYFTNNALSHNTNLTKKIIECNNANHLSIDYGSYLLQIDNCVIIGRKLFDNTDYVAFFNMKITDEWFNATTPSIGTYAEVLAHTANFSIDSSCVIDVDNFDSPVTWARIQLVQGSTELDFRGRTVTSFASTNVTKISNLIVNTLNLTGNSNDITLDNVKANTFNIPSGNVLTIQNGCYLNDCGSPTSIFSGNAVNIADSTVRILKVNVSNTTVIANRSTLYGCQLKMNDYSGSYSDADYTLANNIVLNDCTCDTCFINTNRLTASDTAFNQVIELYPYITNAEYHLFFKFGRCTFTGSSEILVKLRNVTYDNSIVYHVIPDFSITNCHFDGTDYGFRMPFYSDIANGKEFIYAVDRNFTYHGNTGKCPLESVPVIGMVAWDDLTYQSDSYKKSTNTYRLFNLCGDYDSMNSAWTKMGARIVTALKADPSGTADLYDSSPSFLIPALLKTASSVDNFSGLQSGGAVDNYGDMFEIRFAVKNSHYDEDHLIAMNWTTDDK